MKSVPKLLRRFVGILLLSSFFLLLANLVILAVVTAAQAPNGYPWKTAEKAAESMTDTGQGYEMTEKMKQQLKEEQAWAVYVDNHTNACIWHSEGLPAAVPLKFTASEIADVTRGYLDGYPVFTGTSEKGLMILGYPKESFWKHMWPSWDYQFIKNLPKNILLVLLVNVVLIFVIYMTANTTLLKSIKPITDGIQALPSGEPVVLKEKGILSEISENINRTSEVLQSQKFQLRKKETARANWIAGVSHDIRTPLSMVMGYAAQLETDPALSESERGKAAVIRRQSERMKNLINDLNLASKLEYNMQPVAVKPENIIAVVRQVVVDFINMDLEEKFPVEWETDEETAAYVVNGDKDLLKRAVSNLIQNCINHNENGCSIFVSVHRREEVCEICVEDNGTGISEEQIEKLNHTPHYMVCDTNTTEQRHGLGLLIVRQIAESHHGTFAIGHSTYGGFAAKIGLPLLRKKEEHLQKNPLSN